MNLGARMFDDRKVIGSEVEKACGLSDKSSLEDYSFRLLIIQYGRHGHKILS